MTQAIAKEAAKDRGDVYLDRNDLSELRAAGNEFRIREREHERAPLGPGSTYDREKAEAMIEQLLAKTDSTDRYHDVPERIAEDDREQFEQYLKDRSDRGLPAAREIDAIAISDREAQ